MTFATHMTCRCRECLGSTTAEDLELSRLRDEVVRLTSERDMLATTARWSVPKGAHGAAILAEREACAALADSQSCVTNEIPSSASPRIAAQFREFDAAANLRAAAIALLIRARGTP